MAAQRRKEEAEAFQLATQQALICAPASPVKSSPQRAVTLDNTDSAIDEDCQIMRLSPDIRSRIYYYAMDNDFHASLDPISSRYPDAVKTRCKTPALMRTCGQMRSEAGAIWYSETIFIYRRDDVLYKWLQLIGQTNQKLIRTVRRDCISLTKRWAEAYVTFTHSRLRDQKLSLAKEAMEVAYWEPPKPVDPDTKDAAAKAGLVATANAALELEDQDMRGEIFDFDPDLELELENFASNFLESDDAHGDSIMSSVAGSKSSATSVAECAGTSSGDDREKKPKSLKKSTKSSASSVAEDGEKKKPKKSAKSSASSVTEDGEKKKEKAEKKKKDSPSSLAESVMSTKSGKGDKSKPKNSAKPKIKKEPEPEKTWAFVRMETVNV